MPFLIHPGSQRPAVCRLNWYFWKGIPLVTSSLCQDYPRRRAQDFKNYGWESDHWRDVHMFAAEKFSGTMEDSPEYRKQFHRLHYGRWPGLGEGNECHLPQPKLSHLVGLHALEWSNGTFQRRQITPKVSAIKHLVCGRSRQWRIHNLPFFLGLMACGTPPSMIE